MAHPFALDLIGNKFGRLLVKDRFQNKNYRTRWLCLCDCGKEKIAFGSDLKSGHTLSCGCFRKERCLNVVTTHGMSKTPTYQSWLHMRERCLNPLDNHYHRYGGRGISVCDRWINSFENFYADMGEKQTGLSIDRIDNDGNYEPSNCRWADNKTQRRNNSANILVSLNGAQLSLADACDALGLKLNTVYMRIRRGSSHNEALGIKL